MSDINYLQMLKDSHAAIDTYMGRGYTTRLKYLADYIFGFVTYEDSMAELFATKALEVCVAINDHTTFDYIGANDDNRMWFLLMCNMPFFAENIGWASSVRGAWWNDPVILDSDGIFWNGEQVVEPMKLNDREWARFIDAMVNFVANRR